MKFTAVHALVVSAFLWMLTFAAFGYLFQNLHYKWENLNKLVEEELLKTPFNSQPKESTISPKYPEPPNKKSTILPKYGNSAPVTPEDIKYNLSSYSEEWNTFRMAFSQVEKEVRELRASYHSLQKLSHKFRHHRTFAHISGGGGKVAKNYNSSNYRHIKHLKGWDDDSENEGPTHWTGQLEFSKHKCLVVKVSGWYYVFSQIYFYNNQKINDDVLYQIVECQHLDKETRTLMKSFADKKEYTSNYQGGIFHFHQEDTICVKLSDDTQADFDPTTSYFGMFHVANSI